MRTVRFLAIVLLLAAILAALVYIFRFPIAGWAVRSSMAAAGLERPQARVTALTFSGARLEDVSAGGASMPAFSFEEIDATYRLQRVWSERKVDALRVGPGSLRLAVDDAGRISLPGVTLQSNEGGGGLPFDRLSLEDVALIVSAPEGEVRGAIDADYDIREGGEAAVDLSSGGFAWNAFRFHEFASKAQATFSANGQATLNATVDADLEFAGAIARAVSLKITGDGASWRDAATSGFEKFAGAAQIEFTAPDIAWRDPLRKTPTSVAQLEMLFGAPVQRAGLAGALSAVLDASGFEIRIDDEVTPLALTTPDGASLTLRAQGAAPVFASREGRTTSSMQFALKSDGIAASGALDAEREGANWRLAAPVEIAEFTSPALTLDDSRIDIAAESNGQTGTADVSIKSGLRKAVVGRLTLDDAPFNGAFRINADFAARRAVIASTSDCFAIERGRGRIAAQDLDIRLNDITFCNAEGPLAVYTWSGENACTMSGELSARDGTLRFGETYAKGRPPTLRFDATYHPARNTTSIRSDLANGVMTLNDVLDVAGLIGRFEFTLDADEMRATAKVDRMRLTQHLGGVDQLLVFAPVLAAGQGVLNGDVATFTYTLTTPEGYRLGAGAGAHDMKTARGETVITVEDLVFTPIGLQPNRVSPALKGIIDAADGSLHGAVTFGWGPEELSSIADFEFDRISFNGPTRAVTRTRNLTGRVQLTDLLPIATNGVQTIKVERVDLDALKLEKGVMDFSMPGDDTFIIDRGEFPWFGGTIGVYEAKASFAGQAEIPLRAQNIDLKQVLDYVKVEGLTGEGMLSGSLPLIFEEGRARIENGVLRSEGPGVVRYVGAASEQAALAGETADVAFDFLRDLRYNSLEVTVDGALDGALKFGMIFEGVGDVSIRNGVLKDVPVIYRVNLQIENVDLLRKANLAAAIRAQIARDLNGVVQ